MGKSVVYPVYTVCPHPFEVVSRKWVEMFDFFSLFRKKLLICCVLAYSESKKKIFFQRKICLWKNSCVCLLIITCLTPPLPPPAGLRTAIYLLYHEISLWNFQKTSSATSKYSVWNHSLVGFETKVCELTPFICWNNSCISADRS